MQRKVFFAYSSLQLRKTCWKRSSRRTKRKRVVKARNIFNFVEADSDDTKPHGEEGSDEAQSPGNSLSPASGTNLDLLFHNIFCLFDSTVAPFCEATTVPNYDCKFISVCVLKVYWFAFNVVQELQHTQEAGTFWANKPSRKAWSSS